MPFRNVIGCLLLVLLGGRVDAQTAAPTLSTYEDSLALLAYTIVNDSAADNRFTACRALIPKLVRTLKATQSFDYPFSRLGQYVSIQYPADSSFRIFTWQLYVGPDEYRFYGAIQFNDPSLKLIPLVDRSFEMDAEAEQAQLGPDNWYGAVYYALQPVAHGETTYYLLYGYDGHSYYQRRKLVDVLSFDAQGKPTFGAPVFVHDQTVKQRLILEFGADATVKLSYDPLVSMITFDHLTSIANPYGGEGEINVPDGTYDGYELRDGRWYFRDNIFEADSRTPIRPEPIIDAANRRPVYSRGGQ